MQHLDEGTIHSWLDGELTADEAARADAHVRECPQCAAAVAEARGFIAASSRILTALDDAPRGVVPIAAPKRRIDPFIWRVAATVLVIAGGTLVVVKNRGANESLKSALADRAAAVPQATAAANDVPAIALSAKAENEAPHSGNGSRKNKILAQGVTGGTAQIAGVSKLAAPPAASTSPTAQTFAPAGIGSVAAMDAAAPAEPLRVVGTPRQIGAKVTLYEVASGDTVTLTESVPLQLEAAVVRGVPAPMTRRAAEKSVAIPSQARADAAVTAAADSQRAAGATPLAAAVPVPAPTRQQLANAVHTIVWTDPATGNTLSLSGRIPEARLHEIRIRIERERAAAANKKP